MAGSSGGSGGAGAPPAKLEQLPAFKEVRDASERRALFLKKLQLCSWPMDFTNGQIDTREKEMKRQTLLELMDYINSTKGAFSERTYPDVVHMIAANLFRGLAASGSRAQLEPEEEEPALEPAWPHLQYVYEFLLRFVVSSEADPKAVKRYLDTRFLLKLIDLFDSEDPRERDYLKTILHRIYGKFMPYRAFIRKAINNIFYTFVYETGRHNGIAELLEILGSIINGFALPLKEEHLLFLHRSLLPLHKVRFIGMYHQQLSYCVSQFVEKDPKLAKPVFEAILKFWPRTHSPKEVLLLNELEEVLEMVDAREFAAVMAPLFAQVSRCIESPHFQVAERALFLWNNEYIVSLIAQHRAEVLPIVFGALHANSNSHWNQTVHGLTCNVVKLFMEMDPRLFDECTAAHKREQEREQARREERQAAWRDIEADAEANPLFPRVKHALTAKASLAYAMRAQQLREGMTMFEDAPSNEKAR